MFLLDMIVDYVSKVVLFKIKSLVGLLKCYMWVHPWDTSDPTVAEILEGKKFNFNIFKDEVLSN